LRSGAALLSPAALAVVMTMFTGRDRARALGAWSGLAGLGSALGVILGGVLTSEAGWRWIFTINVPIGAALLIAVPLIVPGRPAGVSPAGAPGLDIPGGLLVTAGTGAAIYGLVNAGASGWTALSTLGAFALAVAALGGVRAGGAEDRQPAARRRAAAAPSGRGGRLPDADRDGAAGRRVLPRVVQPAARRRLQRAAGGPVGRPVSSSEKTTFGITAR
jgi:Major Facilitator Superfamily